MLELGSGLIVNFIEIVISLGILALVGWLVWLGVHKLIDLFQPRPSKAHTIADIVLIFLAVLVLLSFFEVV